MNTITLQCTAKLNLTLDVTGRREDGYHTLASVFQTIGIYDTITVRTGQGSGIILHCNLPWIPCDERNLAYRAAKAFLETAGMERSVVIRLHKEIPSGAGMGGGSADAACVLYAMNELLGCGFSNEKLREIGVTLGADVPFILMGGTAYAEGIGEILTPLNPLPEIPVVVVKGTQGISTAEAYAAIDKESGLEHPDNTGMLRAIAEQNIEMTAKYCGNIFESATHCEDVTRAKQALLRHGAMQAVMTGSGSAVFGFFADMEQAKVCAVALKQEFAFASACTTVTQPFLRVPEQENGVECI